MNRISTLISTVVIRHRLLVVIISLLLSMLAASGVRFLTFSNDSRMFFSKQNPQLQALEHLEKTYTKVENVLYIIVPKLGNIFEKKSLEAIEFLTDEAWKLPYSSRVDSITNYQYTTVMGDDLVVANIIQNVSEKNDAEIDAIRKIATTDPMLHNSLLDEKASITSINVNIIKPDDGSYDIHKISRAATELKLLVKEKYPFLDVYITGGVMIEVAFEEAPRRDMLRLVPVMFFLLFFLIFLSLRSLWATFATAAVIILSTITGLGLAGWIGIILTPASANAPVIILTLAVADSIHILVSIFFHLRKGETKHIAIANSILSNFQPVLITSVSTAIGFLTMNFSDAPPFCDLGNIVAMGVIAAFFLSVLFLPSLVALLPLAPPQHQKQQNNPLFSHLAECIINRRLPTLVTTILLIIATSCGIFKIHLNDEFTKYFDHSYEFRVASDMAAEHLAGLEIIDWDLDSGEESGIFDPNYLKTVDDFVSWFRIQPEVRHVYSVTDIIKRLNQNMHNNEPSFYTIPTHRELAAQYLLLYEMNLPFGLDLNHRINVDKSSTRITVSTPNIGTAGVLSLERRGRDWLKEHAPRMHTYGSGLSIIFSFISERNIRYMLKGSVIALLLISLMMIVALGNVQLGLLSLIPNLTPAIMAFGVWGMTVGQVGLAVSVMIAMTLGIVVDDTVHFLAKYQRARIEYGMIPEDAIRYAFTSVGPALLVTTVTLVGGFTVLGFSGFQINCHMGAMTAITIIFALLLDFFLLPALLLTCRS